MNQSEMVVYATAKVHLTKCRIAYGILRDNDGKKTFAGWNLNKVAKTTRTVTAYQERLSTHRWCDYF